MRTEVTRVAYGWALAAILTAGLLVRLFVTVWIPTRPVSDFWEYLRSAESLVQTGRYELAPGIPNHSHPPAYPLVLSFALRIAPPGEGLAFAKLVNSCFAVLAGVFGATLARSLWGEAAGLWTAAAFAFFPRSILMADLIASENLFSPLLMLFLLLCAVSWTRSPSLALTTGIGLVVGALALTRSVAYFLPVVWVLGAMAARWRPRVLAGGLVLLLVAQHAVMLPWAIRNTRALGRFTFLTNVGGVGLFIGNRPGATGGWQPWREDLERLRPGIFRRGPVAVDDAARQEGWRWIRTNPGRAAELYARKLWIVLTDDSIVADFAIFGEGMGPPFPVGPVVAGPHPLKTRVRLVAGILRTSGVLLYLAALGGIVLLVRSAREGSLVSRALAVGFCAAALSIPVFSAVIAVNGRYRWPMEDAIMPLAGLFLARATSGPRPIREHWDSATPMEKLKSAVSVTHGGSCPCALAATRPVGSAGDWRV